LSVRYVISEPTPPTWWAKNKATVCCIAGLLAGLWLGGGLTGPQAAACPGSRPSPAATSGPTGR
jgi:hypothetical protein